MTAPYHPPYLRARRSAWLLTLEFALFCLVIGVILALAFVGAATMEPVIP